MHKLASQSTRTLAIVTALTLGLHFADVDAQENREHGMSRQAAEVATQREPRGYTRIDRPRGAEVRPGSLDRQDLSHNFQAKRTYHIGPYHAPEKWQYRRWHYGETLPARYFSTQYELVDFWLFGLDVPPMGIEWVRYGPDALLVNTINGEVIQVVYGIFL